MQVHSDNQIHRDLIMAAEFQRAVLPLKPEVAYLSASVLYRPSAHISGDVYNFQLNREREFSVYLGDATGHGIAAALLTMMVHLSLENFPGNLGTDEILRRLNTMIGRHETGLSLASQLFRISPDGKLRVTHAGQPSLVILPRTARNPVVFEQGGCPIGMFDKEMVPYTEETLQLTRGDRLLAYTDGLTDWKDHQGRSYGDQRLLELLVTLRECRINELPQNILEAVLDFAGNEPNHDDVTLLCFEYQGTG